MQMCIDAAEQLRRPPKVLADLMGVSTSTLYRWLADRSIPAHLIRQFEAFCGGGYVSEYLCTANGGRVVIDIPTGKCASVADLAEMQGNSSNAFTLLSRFYEGKTSAEETLQALTTTLTDIAYQRQNVLKHAEPELGLFEGECNV